MRLQDIERAVALKTELDNLKAMHAEIERTSRFRDFQFGLRVAVSQGYRADFDAWELPIPEAFAREWIKIRMVEVTRALDEIGVVVV